MTAEAACKGNPKLADHPLIELGNCAHHVAGAAHTYTEFACPDCGVTARKGPLSFACGPRMKAITPTPENCLALAWKQEHKP